MATYSRLKDYKRIFIAIVSTLLFIAITTTYADKNISLFPLTKYDQQVDHWLKPSDADYNKPLLSDQFQLQRLQEFYRHYFSTAGNDPAPWNSNYINKLLQRANELLIQEKILITQFSNHNKSADNINYGENFRPYLSKWVNAITTNMDLPQFNSPIVYQDENRGIAIANLNARYLPTEDVSFYDYKLPGQGYPFDNLQFSAIWVGTPLYIIGQTKDHAWSLVLTPEFIAWVKSNGIARVNNLFVSRWQRAAKRQMAAIIMPQTSIIDKDGDYQFTAYVGSIFPVVDSRDKQIQIMVPQADTDRNAHIGYATLSDQQAAIMPLAATPHNFANLIKNLQDRPYGWGNMYFYNDCSAELKSLYAPFAIWLPRQSSQQPSAGEVVDKSDVSLDDRINYLIQNGHKLMTIVYIGDHVFMYLGHYTNPNSTTPELIAMTYQNVWGLAPKNGSKRVVIGQSVLFPLLKQYPEDPSLTSLAHKKYFQVSFLDKMPVQNDTINVKELINP